VSRTRGGRTLDAGVRPSRRIDREFHSPLRPASAGLTSRSPYPTPTHLCPPVDIAKNRPRLDSIVLSVRTVRGAWRALVAF
jgi:hypothetical protein